MTNLNLIHNCKYNLSLANYKRFNNIKESLNKINTH